MLLQTAFSPTGEVAKTVQAGQRPSFEAEMPIKEAVRIAQGNNFMGLICNQNLLVSFSALPPPFLRKAFFTTPHTDYTRYKQNLAPALVQTIKTAGLVLIANLGEEEEEENDRDVAIEEDERDADEADISSVTQRLAMRPRHGEGKSGSVAANVDGTLEKGVVLEFKDTVDV